MDLFTTLRVSLYLLVASGAMSVAIAERSLYTLLAVALAGIGAHIAMDRLRLRPLSSNLGAVFTLALLVLALRPLHEDERWHEHFPAAVAHFLILWQALLFFSAYSGPILLTFCGSTLAVVVMSGVMQPGPSLILRVGAFVALVAWTLYIHAVWRARQEFAGGSTLVTLEASGARVSDQGGELPERAFWGSVTLVAGMTASCMLLGTLIFVFAPRFNVIQDFFDHRDPNVSSGGKPIPGRSGPNAMVSGIDGHVPLNHLGPIGIDERIAFTARFDKPLSAIAKTQRRVLFKALNFSVYQNASWNADGLQRKTIESQNGAPIPILDPSRDDPLPRSADEFSVVIEPSADASTLLFAPGPVVRVANPKHVSIDTEGALRSAEPGLLVKYELTVQNWPACGPRDAAEHHDLSRYVRQHGLSPALADKMSALAQQLTHSLASDREKALAISRWLERNCTYSRGADSGGAANSDPLERFLFSADSAQRKGPCGFFATAFVLLSRFSSLPARLCNGYAVNPRADEMAGRDLNVRNADAHAWAEIYFKGVGWVPFDPTPPQRETEERFLAQKNQANATKPSSTAAEPTVAKTSGGTFQDVWDDIMHFDGAAQRKLFEQITGSTRARNGESYWGWTGIGILVLGLAGVLAATGVLANFFVKRARQRRQGGALPSARARAAVGFYNDLLQTLSRRGYTRKPGQTPREFADAVVRRGGKDFAPVLEITGIFEAVRYGGSDLDQAEFNRLQEALDRIRLATF